MGLITAILVALGSLAAFVALTTLSLLVTQPLQSSLVRLRANYLPRAVSLGLGDERASSRPGLFGIRSEPMKIGPVTSGVFGMARRVVTLEGWPGLYRGAFPGALQMLWISVIGSALIAPFVASGPQWRKSAATGDIGAFPMLIYLFVVVFVDLPMTIICNRTIVHPHALPLTKPLDNLRQLLSPGELKRPWKLYALPGMASVCVSQTLLTGLAMPIAHKLALGKQAGATTSMSDLPADSPRGSVRQRASAYSIAAFLVFNLIVLAIAVPLQCAAIRLSTQRPRESQPAATTVPPINPVSHQASVPSDDAPADEDEGEETPLGAWQAHAGSRLPSQPGETEEPVVALRPCASSAIEADAGNGTVRPYEGLWDCLTTMVQEEGLESVYRGWGVSVCLLPLSFVATVL